MCLLNCSTKTIKYKHLLFSERTMIETWYNKDKKSKKKIAELLHKSERTIRREIQRGLVSILDYEYNEITEYSAQIAQKKYEYNKTGKGSELKLDSDINLVKHIEIEIIENKKYPEVIAYELKDNNFSIRISGRTIRNCIKKGMIFEKVEDGKIIYKKKILIKIKKKE